MRKLPFPTTRQIAQAVIEPMSGQTADNPPLSDKVMRSLI